MKEDYPVILKGTLILVEVSNNSKGVVLIEQNITIKEFFDSISSLGNMTNLEWLFLPKGSSDIGEFRS